MLYGLRLLFATVILGSIISGQIILPPNTGGGGGGGMTPPASPGIVVSPGAPSTSTTGRSIVATPGGDAAVTNGDGQGGNIGIAVDALIVPQYRIVTDPPVSTCTTGRDFAFNTDGANDGGIYLYACGPTDNNWQPLLSTASASGITTLNTLTAATQTFATGTTGTDFGISSATSTHTFNLPIASATNTGKLSNTDWTTFNGKMGGSIADTQVAYGNGTAIAGSANHTWNNTNQTLTITPTTSNPGLTMTQPTSGAAPITSLISAATNSNFASAAGFGLQICRTTALTSGSATGTWIGGNCATGFTGDYIRMQLNGSDRFQVTGAGGALLNSAAGGLTSHFNISVNAVSAMRFNSSSPTGGAFTTMNSQLTGAAANVNTGIIFGVGGYRNTTAGPGSLAAQNLVATTATGYNMLHITGHIYVTTADVACVYTPKVNFTYNSGSRQMTLPLTGAAGSILTGLTNPAVNDFASFTATFPHTGTGAVTIQVDAVGTCSTGVFEIAAALYKVQN